MTRDEETALRKRARDAKAEVRLLEEEMDNHNPNWRTRLWRGAHSGAQLAGVAVGSGPMMKDRDWGPMKANTWIGLAANAADVWIEHPAIRVVTEIGKGFLGATVALKRSGQG